MFGLPRKLEADSKRQPRIGTNCQPHFDLQVLQRWRWIRSLFEAARGHNLPAYFRRNQIAEFWCHHVKFFFEKVGVIVLRKLNPPHFLKKNKSRLIISVKKINYDLAVHGIVVQMAEKNLIYFVTQQFKLKTHMYPLKWFNIKMLERLYKICPREDQSSGAHSRALETSCLSQKLNPSLWW